ncbi:MAG TPA: hypothetical protein VJV78_40045 [Polyangiales bacterium]|nr:hypothetical protein [Polyangiales bacterium]
MQTRSQIFAVVMALSLIIACGDDSDSGGGGGSGGSVAGASGGSSGAGGSSAAPTCAAYCSLAVGMMCTGALQVYADAAACQAGCTMITTPGSVTDTSGNTLGCRIYHLTVANMNATNAMMHCLHGKVMSDVCK